MSGNKESGLSTRKRKCRTIRSWLLRMSLYKWKQIIFFLNLCITFICISFGINKCCCCSCCHRCFLWFKFSEDKLLYFFMHPAFLLQRSCGSLGVSTYWQNVFPRRPSALLKFPDQRAKGTMWTSTEIEFRFRLKLQITLVESTYPNPRPQCPSLSPPFLLVSSRAEYQWMVWVIVFWCCSHLKNSCLLLSCNLWTSNIQWVCFKYFLLDMPFKYPNHSFYLSLTYLKLQGPTPAAGKEQLVYVAAVIRVVTHHFSAWRP